LQLVTERVNLPLVGALHNHRHKRPLIAVPSVVGAAEVFQHLSSRIAVLVDEDDSCVCQAGPSERQRWTLGPGQLDRQALPELYLGVNRHERRRRAAHEPAIERRRQQLGLRVSVM
jgi:hypothetical protein